MATTDAKQIVRAQDYRMTRAEEKQNLAKIKAYAKMPEVQERFAALLGNEAGRVYIESVIIQVAGRPDLQACNPKSLMISAMRAASLKLSVDPAVKQAHLVAFKNEATLIVDYHGLVNLSEQTGWYEIPPNVGEVWKGETVEVERFSGKLTITGTPDEPRECIGWWMYFKAKSGIERWLYMTNEEIDAHGKHYSRSFDRQGSPWQTEREKMRRKTVLRIGVSRWGYFSPHAEAVIFEGDLVEAQAEDLPEDENIEYDKPPEVTEQENMNALGFGEGPVVLAWNDPVLIKRLAQKKRVKQDYMLEILTGLHKGKELPDKVTLAQADDLAARMNI